jgi:hypothetical protein
MFQSSTDEISYITAGIYKMSPPRENKRKIAISKYN